jgi:excisionase family DNA binding protein
MDCKRDNFDQTPSLKTHDLEQLLDVPQAAVLLCVKPKTLYAWVSRKQIPHCKLNSLVRFHRGELIEWTKAPMIQ